MQTKKFNMNRNAGFRPLPASERYVLSEQRLIWHFTSWYLDIWSTVFNSGYFWIHDHSNIIKDVSTLGFAKYSLYQIALQWYCRIICFIHFDDVYFVLFYRKLWVCLGQYNMWFYNTMEIIYYVCPRVDKLCRIFASIAHTQRENTPFRKLFFIAASHPSTNMQYHATLTDKLMLVFLSLFTSCCCTHASFFPRSIFLTKRSSSTVASSINIILISRSLLYRKYLFQLTEQ